MQIQQCGIVLTVINALLLVITIGQLQPVVAQGETSVLRGRALEIVDGRGQVRARINVEPAATLPDGKTSPEAVVLRLTDPSGRIRVKLDADHDGAGMVLADDSQQPGVHLLARQTGSFVKVIHQDGREQVVKP